MRQVLGILATLAVLGLAACGGGAVRPAPRPDTTPMPGEEPRSKYGNPPSYEVNGETYHVLPTARGYQERGRASWYGEDFHGKRTSSGEPYNMHAMTAAHRTLPLPTYVRVTNVENAREIIVRVNDRGPFVEDRVIDLSYAAATELGLIRNGTGEVEVTAIDPIEAAADKTTRGRVVASSRPGELPVAAAPQPPPMRTAPRRTAAAPVEAPDDVLAPDEIPASARRRETADPALIEPIDEPVIRELPDDGTVAVSAPATPAPMARTVTPAPLRGHYLQAGAFSNPKNAENQAERLRRAGFDTVGVYPTRGVLKVRLGPYPTLAATESDRERLGRMGIRAYLVEE